MDNGVLLSPTYDALFDRHLISFDANGNILLSPKLSEELLTQLGVTGKEKIELFEGMRPYLNGTGLIFSDQGSLHSYTTTMDAFCWLKDLKESLWAFGSFQGKIESNESPKNLTRVKEELAAVVTPLRVHPAYEFLNDKGLIIEFFPVTCDWETHPLTLHEHQRVEFVEVREVPSWDLAPPDYNALKYLEHIP